MEDIHEEARKRIVVTDVVLDIGAGIRPQTFFKPKVSLIVEPHSEYLLHLVESRVGHLIIGASAQKCLHWLPDKSVDTVFALDVIEHLERQEGENLVREMQRLARVQVVIFTPIGMMPQTYKPGDKDAWGMNGTHWQTHRSAWFPEDFPGWEIIARPDFHTTNGAFYAICAF